MSRYCVFYDIEKWVMLMYFPKFADLRRNKHVNIYVFSVIRLIPDQMTAGLTNSEGNSFEKTHFNYKTNVYFIK